VCRPPSRLVICAIIHDRLTSVRFQCLFFNFYPSPPFRETTLAVYIFVLASMAAYTFTFKLDHIAITFVTAGVTGYLANIILHICLMSFLGFIKIGFGQFLMTYCSFQVFYDGILASGI
jgi:hypothetical protein